MNSLPETCIYVLVVLIGSLIGLILGMNVISTTIGLLFGLAGAGLLYLVWGREAQTPTQ